MEKTGAAAGLVGASSTYQFAGPEVIESLEELNAGGLATA